MGFAEDEVKKYIRQNYSKFQNMRLNEMLLYLPCLTPADRQAILCATDRKGDHLSVFEFFDHLWCRSGWVTQLITALRENNSPLATDIQQVYDAAQLSSRRRPPASPPSPSTQRSRSPVSAPVGPSEPPSDDPPRNQSRPTRDQPPESANALTPPPSASLQDVVDYRSPVQETKCPSIEGKALGKDVKRKISTPGQHNSNAAESSASLTVQHENLTDAQVASPRSLVQHQVHLGEAYEEEVHSTAPASSKSDTGNLVRNWDGFQQRPVCVKNGYFGNMNRSVDSGVSPAPEPAASSGLTPSRNQPEEDCYLSSDCSSLAARGHDGAQGEEQKIQPLWGYQQEDLLDTPTNSKPLLLQMQDDEGQKGAPGRQDSSSNVNNTLHLLQKEGNRYTQRDNGRTVGVREMPNDAIPKGSAFANFQRKGKTPLPSVTSETTTASCFEQDSPSICSEKVSPDDSLCCEATPDVGQLSEGCMADSKGNTVDLETKETPQTASLLGRSSSKSSQFPQRSSIKECVGQISNTVPVGRFAFPPSDFTGFSSTDGIPPNSPAVVSAILSDGYPEDLKPPVQEREPAESNPWTSSEQMTGNASLRATVVSPSSVTEMPTNSRKNRNNAGSSSRYAHVFCSNQEEEDISLIKPGVLVSGEITGGPLDQLSGPQGREYSGTSDRLRMSSKYSEKSDPLMLSGSTWKSHSEDSGRNLQNDKSSDEGSVKTHTVHIQESPSVDLAGAPEVIHPAVGNASFLDSVPRNQPVKKASSHPVRNDNERNSLQKESIDDTVVLCTSDSTLFAVGFALASLVAVALVVYKLKK